MKKIIIPICLALFVAMSFSSFQLVKTNLKITVLDDLGNIQEGATVKLFLNEKDFKEEKNAILSTDEKTTDAKGIVWFKDVEPRAYYVLAVNGAKNNWGGGIKTGELMAKKVNKVNIIID